MAIPLRSRFYLKCILGALDPKSTTSLFYLECILEALDPANRKKVSRDMHFVMGELGTANHTDTPPPLHRASTGQLQLQTGTGLPPAIGLTSTIRHSIPKPPWHLALHREAHEFLEAHEAQSALHHDEPAEP